MEGQSLSWAYTEHNRSKDLPWYIEGLSDWANQLEQENRRNTWTFISLPFSKYSSFPLFSHIVLTWFFITPWIFITYFFLLKKLIFKYISCFRFLFLLLYFWGSNFFHGFNFKFFFWSFVFGSVSLRVLIYLVSIFTRGFDYWLDYYLLFWLLFFSFFSSFPLLFSV